MANTLMLVGNSVDIPNRMLELGRPSYVRIA